MIDGLEKLNQLHLAVAKKWQICFIHRVLITKIESQWFEQSFMCVN